MGAYTYRNKETGEVIRSSKPLNPAQLKVVSAQRRAENLEKMASVSRANEAALTPYERVGRVFQEHPRVRGVVKGVGETITSIPQQTPPVMGFQALRHAYDLAVKGPEQKDISTVAKESIPFAQPAVAAVSAPTEEEREEAQGELAGQVGTTLAFGKLLGGAIKNIGPTESSAPFTPATENLGFPRVRVTPSGIPPPATVESEIVTPPQMEPFRPAGLPTQPLPELPAGRVMRGTPSGLEVAAPEPVDPSAVRGISGEFPEVIKRPIVTPPPRVIEAPPSSLPQAIQLAEEAPKVSDVISPREGGAAEPIEQSKVAAETVEEPLPVQEAPPPITEETKVESPLSKMSDKELKSLSDMGDKAAQKELGRRLRRSRKRN